MQKILLFCFLFAFIATFTTFLIVRRRDIADRNTHFSKEKLQEYEAMLRTKVQDTGIHIHNSPEDVLQFLGYHIEEKELNYSVEAKITDNRTIVLNTKLSPCDRTFTLWHEIAHIIQGQVSTVARVPHSLKRRPVDEQICDYIAAALILPANELYTRLSDAKYDCLKKEEKKKFVNSIASEKSIYTEVVLRRIAEVKLLFS